VRETSVPIVAAAGRAGPARLTATVDGRAGQRGAGVSKGEATKQAVLDQAVEVASRLGLSGLTIGTLASQVELSKSGLFAHFRSKEQLQLQVLAHARETFTAQVIRPALAAPRGEKRLRTLFEAWLVTGRESAPGCLFVSAATEFDDQPGAVRDQLVRDHQDLVESLALMFRTGISEGQFREDADPEQFAHELFGVMLAYFHAVRLIRDPAAESRTRRAFDTLLDNARI
jgi:AcrR family transcriptional regulator